MRSQSLINAQNKYRQENTEILNKKGNTKIKCDCGCYISYSVLARHKTSKKHNKNVLLK